MAKTIRRGTTVLAFALCTIIVVGMGAFFTPEIATNIYDNQSVNTIQDMGEDKSISFFLTSRVIDNDTQNDSITLMLHNSQSGNVIVDEVSVGNQTTFNFTDENFVMVELVEISHDRFILHYTVSTLFGFTEGQKILIDVMFMFFIVVLFALVIGGIVGVGLI